MKLIGRVVVTTLGLVMMSSGCSELRSSKADKADNFPGNVSTTSLDGDQLQGEQNRLALTAVLQAAADIQLSQFDGLVSSSEFKRLALSGGESGGWGQASVELKAAAENGQAGGWGSSDGTPSQQSQQSATTMSVAIGGNVGGQAESKLAISRDCELGGQIVTSFSVKNINPNGTAAFSESTTPELTTETSEAILEFRDCQFADASHQEVEVDGQLRVPVVAKSLGAFSVQGTTFSVAGSGAAEVTGQLKLSLPNKTVNCQINVSAASQNTSSEVQRAQRKGSIRFESQIDGTLCGEAVKALGADAKVTF